MTPDLTHTAYLAIEARILSRQLDASDLRAVVEEVVKAVRDSVWEAASKEGYEEAEDDIEDDVDALKRRVRIALKQDNVVEAVEEALDYD